MQWPAKFSAQHVGISETMGEGFVKQVGFEQGERGNYR